MEEPVPMYDLVVIGSGPAGSSAAITAARSGARTLLLERGRFPRTKVCGEFVSAESLGLLSWLLDSRGKDLLNEANRIPKLRIFSDGLVLTSQLDPPAASVSRFDLDAALWEAAGSSGVEAREQITVEALSGGGPFIVCAGENAFESRSVINASGRWSRLTAAGLINSKPGKKWLGVKAHFAEEQLSQSVDLYFFPGGYCGVQPVVLRSQGKENRINVCAMVRTDIASTLSGVFEQNSFLQERSRHWSQLTEPVSTSPLIFREPRPLQGNVLLAGDAAAFVDPFVGDGISLALRSGALAARALIPYVSKRTSLAAAAQSYRRAYESELGPVFRVSSRLRPIFFLLPRVLRVALLAGLKRSPALVRYFVQHTR